jgi:hypothetical protein
LKIGGAAALDRGGTISYKPRPSPAPAEFWPAALAGTPLKAQVAQLVEQRTENPRVGGSIPPLGTTFLPLKIIGLLEKSIRRFAGPCVASGWLMSN